jgi:hypothetical protein
LAWFIPPFLFIFELTFCFGCSRQTTRRESVREPAETQKNLLFRLKIVTDWGNG